jgi:hypothetical protein
MRMNQKAKLDCISGFQTVDERSDLKSSQFLVTSIPPQNSMADFRFWN